MPMKIPTIDRIMITSIATARMLMMDRKGRCNRLAITSLFMVEYGSGSESGLRFGLVPLSLQG
jgi:hypothetical protein